MNDFEIKIEDGSERIDEFSLGLNIKSLILHFNGVKFSAGSGKGWTDADLDALTRQYILTGYPVGKIIHVYGLQKSSKGAIRLPKFGEIRIDKHISD